MKKDDIKSYYNSKYHHQIRTRSISFYENTLDLLKAKKGKILDIGCGAGYLLKAAEKRGLIADGIDISEKAVAFAKEITKKSKIRVGEAESLPYSSNSFDYIACLGSLEHFLDIKQAIKEMVRVAKNTAKFCIAVPNSNFLLWKFKKRKGTGQIQETLLSLEEWRQVLLSSGLKIIDIKRDKGPIASENELKNFIFKILAPCLPLAITYQLIFICKKGENYKNLYTEEYFRKNYSKNGVKRDFFTPERKYIERNRDIFRLLEPHKKDVVLELGCASGTTSKKISRHVKRVIAIDFSEKAINLAEKENAGENIDYRIANATDLSFLKRNNIDKIAAIDFAEHIDDVTLTKVLREAHRVLKTGGIIAIYTPQRLHWVEIIKHFLKTDPTHIGVRAPDKIIKIAKKRGFRPDLLYFSPNPYPGLRWVDKTLSDIPLINRFFRFRTCLRLRKKIKNIAYIGGQGIGDLIISIPVLKKLKTVFPEATIEYVCVKTKYRDFFEDCIYIESVIEIDRSLLKLPSQIIDLGKKRFDLTVMPAPNERPTKILAKLISIKKPVVCERDLFSEKNIVEKEFSTLKQIGIQAKQEGKKLEWPFSLSESKSKINKVLKENKISKQDLLIGIHAGADKKLAANLWLGKRWAKVTEYLIEKLKAKVVFVGGKDDEEHMKEIVNLLKKKVILNLVNKLSIKETATLINKCKLFISTNSGPMWMAAALHKPQIVLSGPSLLQWNPYNDKAIVIKKRIDRKGCWPPCGSKSDTKCKYEDNLCMKSIKVEDVIKAIKKIRRNK